MAKRFQFRLRSLLLAVVPVSALALAIGNYLRRPATIPACGLINLDGTPISNIRVVFSPVDPGGLAAMGLTDKAGRFNLSTPTPTETDPDSGIPGALPGSYRVSIMRFEVIPLRYWEPKNSGLTAEVTEGGPNDFDFNLTTP